jgi:hypothetical protein
MASITTIERIDGFSALYLVARHLKMPDACRIPDGIALRTYSSEAPAVLARFRGHGDAAI